MQPPQCITINGIELPILTYRAQRVATFAMIDQIHQRHAGTACQTFHRHAKQFIQGQDYFACEAYEAPALGCTAAHGLTVLTESGYLKLAKALDDDRDEISGAIQRQVVDSYFRAKKVSQAQWERTPPHALLHAVQQMANLEVTQQRQARLQTERGRRLTASPAQADASPHYYSVVAWADMRQRALTNPERRDMGRLGWQLASRRGVPLGTCQDERDGEVTTYPLGLLDEAWNLYKRRRRST